MPFTINPEAAYNNYFGSNATKRRTKGSIKNYLKNRSEQDQYELDVAMWYGTFWAPNFSQDGQKFLRRLWLTIIKAGMFCDEGGGVCGLEHNRCAGRSMFVSWRKGNDSTSSWRYGPGVLELAYARYRCASEGIRNPWFKAALPWRTQESRKKSKGLLERNRWIKRRRPLPALLPEHSLGRVGRIQPLFREKNYR